MKIFRVVLIPLMGIGLALAEPLPLVSAVSLEQATKQVMSLNAGYRILSAKTEDIQGVKVHVIKTLTPDGRIQQQNVMADTGAIVDIDSN